MVQVLTATLCPENLSPSIYPSHKSKNAKRFVLNLEKHTTTQHNGNKEDSEECQR